MKNLLDTLTFLCYLSQCLIESNSLDSSYLVKKLNLKIKEL